MGQTKARKAKQAAAAAAAAGATGDAPTKEADQSIAAKQTVQSTAPKETVPPTKETGQSMAEVDRKAKKRKRTEQHTVSTPGSAESGRVFVGNMPTNIDEETLRAHFESCGTIQDITWQQPNGEFKGCGYLQFDTSEAAASAVALSGTKLWKRKLTVSLPKPRPIDQCKHCKRSGHAAKNCTFGDVAHERFVMCDQTSPTVCFKRKFIVPLRRASHLFDPAASHREQGRLDVGLRCLSAAMFRSQSLRHNTQVLLCFGASDHFVEVSGSLVRDLRPDEAHLAGRISNAVPLTANAHGWPTPEQKGFALKEGGVLPALELAMEQAADEEVAVLLLDSTSAAQPVEKFCAELVGSRKPPQSLIVLLGDDRGLSAETEAAVEQTVLSGGGKLHRVSLGGDVLFASHCIVLVQHYLDKFVHKCTSREPRKYASAQTPGRYK